MPVFSIGLILGLLVGGVTYALTHNPVLALVGGGITAVACWFGYIVLIFIDEGN